MPRDKTSTVYWFVAVGKQPVLRSVIHRGERPALGTPDRLPGLTPMTDYTATEFESTDLESHTIFAWVNVNRGEDCFLNAAGIETAAIAADGGESLDVSSYSEHIKPPEQGAKRYVRCDACSRELLVELGSRGNLLHTDSYLNAEYC